MTSRAAARPLRQLCQLVGAAGAREVPDSELVARFAERGDAARGAGPLLEGGWPGPREKSGARVLLGGGGGWGGEGAGARRGVPLSTLKSRREEGRDRLRRRLARRGLSLSAALSTALLSA